MTSGGRRRIGPIGTLVCVVLGLVILLFGSMGGQIIVISGRLRSHVELLSLILGVVALPVLLLGLQWVRARLAPARLQATGPVSMVLNILIFIALASTPSYAPQLSFVGYAAFVFLAPQFCWPLCGAMQDATCWPSPTGSWRGTTRLDALCLVRSTTRSIA